MFPNLLNRVRFARGARRAGGQLGSDCRLPSSTGPASAPHRLSASTPQSAELYRSDAPTEVDEMQVNTVMWSPALDLGDPFWTETSRFGFVRISG